MTVSHLLMVLIAVCAIGFWFLIDAVTSGVNDLLGRIDKATNLFGDKLDDIEQRLCSIIDHSSETADSVGLLESRSRPHDPDDYD